MYSSLSKVYDKLMDVDYTKYIDIVNQELEDRQNLLILDLGCGSGSLIGGLLNYGNVIGVDISEEMLAIASNKFPTANYYALDLLDLENLNIKFDFIVSAFDVFCYLENFDAFCRGLQGVYSSMKQGAKFIFDIHTPNKINYLLEHQPFAYEDEEISYIWFTYPTDNELEVESELSFFVKEEQGLYRKLEEFQKQRTYEIEVIKKAILNVGFEIKDYFCDFDRHNKDVDNSERLHFILIKN